MKKLLLALAFVTTAAHADCITNTITDHNDDIADTRTEHGKGDPHWRYQLLFCMHHWQTRY